jgi:hypothetical protein
MLQAVNALVAQIKVGDSESKLLELLGSPDERVDARPTPHGVAGLAKFCGADGVMS